ncbi:MAG: hypothetical protein V3T39_03585, partial [Gammaproteobacteria bacterium]
VTEYEEPQAVIGSYLHRYAYPDWYAKHQDKNRKLKEGYHHRGGPVACLQLRGEYLYAAAGKKGFRVYDVASVANKGVSQRIISAPFGPGGHDTNLKTENATCMALPTNQPIAPDRNQGELMRVTNMEQPFHAMYNYAFITDAVEGLIAVNVNTLADGDPRNNILERAKTWNENKILYGARHISIGGHYAYIAADAGVVIVDIDDPLSPQLVGVLPVNNARATAIQFRYLFVLDDTGMRVADITLPEEARMLEDVHVALRDPHRVYVARTYAYVAGGSEGLVIIDVKDPAKPSIYQRFTANGKITDARDVVIGAAYASMYAYVADGNSGLKVVQMISPTSQPNFYGFSPAPKPELIAWYKTSNPAIALSRGLERDRAVDDSGNQSAVFGRIGSRPFTLEEMHKLYLDRNKRPWKVSNEE